MSKFDVVYTNWLETFYILLYSPYNDVTFRFYYFIDEWIFVLCKYCS